MSRRLTKREKRELNNVAKRHWKAILVILLLLVVLFVVAYYMGWIDLLIAKFRPDDNDDEVVLSTAGGYETTVTQFDDLKVTFLDVGQADCIIVQLPDGKNMIIDSGDFNSDQDVIEAFTTANEIDTFHYLLLTHQDRDHVGNMDWVLENYKVNFIFRPNNYSSHSMASSLPAEFNPVITDEDAYVSTSAAYAEFMVAAYNEGCTVELFNKDSDFTNTMILGDEKKTYSFDFLTPTATREQVKYENPNDYSPIFVLEYAGRTIMFNGDAEEEALEEYLTNYSGNYKNIDVLKVGHHGSLNATSSAFLNAVDPEIAVIQCGLGNDYGHPHQQVLDMFTNYGNVELYRTDTNGTITLSVSASGEMDTTLTRTDLTYNYTCGDEMPETLQSVRGFEEMDGQMAVVRILRDCAFVERKVVL